MSTVSTEMSTETPDPPDSRNQKRSLVHQHFTFSEKDKKYQCNHCPKLLAKEKQSGTGNLLKHLRSQHPKTLTSDEKQQKPATIGPLPAAFKNMKKLQDDFHRFLVEFIVKTDQPFSIVEADSFLKLINCNRTTPISVPKRDTIKRKLQDKFESEKLQLIEVLKRAPGKISLVVDCWTTRNGHCFHGILA
ncbi:unnamed protein product, partial [Allacma fusca]